MKIALAEANMDKARLLQEIRKYNPLFQLWQRRCRLQLLRRSEPTTSTKAAGLITLLLNGSTSCRLIISENGNQLWLQNTLETGRKDEKHGWATPKEPGGFTACCPFPLSWQYGATICHWPRAALGLQTRSEAGAGTPRLSVHTVVVTACFQPSPPI